MSEGRQQSARMKTELLLDHETILANQARPVHFALRFTADAVAAAARQPAAFCIVLDRSGSMEGTPLDHALAATRTAIKNLRKEDQFALVVFDDTAQVVLPLQPAARKSGWSQRVGAIVHELSRLVMVANNSKESPALLRARGSRCSATPRKNCWASFRAAVRSGAGILDG